MSKYRVGLYQKELNLMLFALGVAAAHSKLEPNMQRAIQELAQTVATNAEVVE